MKNIAIIVTVLLIAAAVYFFFIKEKKKTPEEEAAAAAAAALAAANGGIVPPPPVDPHTQEPPAPPAEIPPANSPLYFTDEGLGLIAVMKRMELLGKSGEYQKQVAMLDTQMFAGLKGNCFSAVMGGVSRINWPLTKKAVNVLNDTKTMTVSGDPKTMMQTIQRKNLDFIETKILPAFLPENAKGGGEKNFFKHFICEDGNYPGCPIVFSIHDRQFENRGKEFALDLNTLSNNILAISTELDKLVQEKAIQDLLAAGWKFVGYSAPV